MAKVETQSSVNDEFKLKGFRSDLIRLALPHWALDDNTHRFWEKRWFFRDPFSPLGLEIGCDLEIRYKRKTNMARITKYDVNNANHGKSPVIAQVNDLRLVGIQSTDRFSRIDLYGMNATCILGRELDEETEMPIYRVVILSGRDIYKVPHWTDRLPGSFDRYQSRSRFELCIP